MCAASFPRYLACLLAVLTLTNVLQPQNAHVPGVPEASVIWSEFFASTIKKPTFRTPFQGWHT